MRNLLLIKSSFLISSYYTIYHLKKFTTYEKTRMSKYALGIDLGTTNCEVGVVFPGGVTIIKDKRGKIEIPSVVNISNKKGKLSVLVGNFATGKKITDPENTIFDTKRMLGKNYDDPNIQELKQRWPFHIEQSDTNNILLRLNAVDHFYQPYEISGEILKYLSDIGNSLFSEEEKTNEVVITIPANFGDKQRTETIEAAKYAGLNVLSILNEPTAAGFAYLCQRVVEDESNILIFDFGGGTLDVSVIYVNKNEITVKATDGDMFLGGRDFDENTLYYVIEQLDLEEDFTNDPKKMSKLREKVVEAKIELSQSETALIEEDENGEYEELEIDLEKFEEVNEKLISRIFAPINRVLASAELKKDDIDSIILAGGSSNMKFVRRKLKEFLGKEPFNGINPIEAVATGAAQFAAKIKNEIPNQLKNNKLNDICPFSIGTLDNLTGEMEVIIPKGSRIPISVIKSNFRTVYYRQEQLLIEVLEGESKLVNDNDLIGQFTIENLPLTENFFCFNVTFSIDQNGVLSVKAKLESGGGEGSLDIDIFKNKTKNKLHTDICLNEELNEFNIFFQNIIRFIEINMSGLMRYYSRSVILKSLNEARDYLKNAESIYNDIDFVGLSDFAGGFKQRFRWFFRNNPTPSFLKL